jgi:hypothetical protein
MTPSPPPAEGLRLRWKDLPEAVRLAVADRLGSPVIAAASQRGGFSPGVAARLRTAAGGRAFLKAVGPRPNPHSRVFHRREAQITAALPPAVPAPRLLWSFEAHGWVVLAFEDVDGRLPALPWQADELERVLAALAALTAALTPSPLPAAVAGRAADSEVVATGHWRRLREDADGVRHRLDPWSRRHLDALADLDAAAPAAVAGDTLLHSDLRADNLLLTPDRVLVVDWPHARTGAPWLDAVFFAPSVAMQGGPPPEDLLARVPAAAPAPPADVSAAIAAVAGFFTRLALLPPPPGLATVRAFQDAQGVVAREWLARRTGWD